MTQKKFVFRPLSRYILCTRSIQFLLQNIHVISFSDNDDVICCFVSRNKDILHVLLLDMWIDYCRHTTQKIRDRKISRCVC